MLTFISGLLKSYQGKNYILDVKRVTPSVQGGERMWAWERRRRLGEECGMRRDDRVPGGVRERCGREGKREAAVME